MRTSIRRVLAPKVTRGNEWAQEWDEAELVERLEALEAQTARLRTERDRLRGELSLATGRESGSRLGELHLPHGPGPGRLAWWTLPLLALLIVVPWAVIAATIWLLVL